MGSAAGVELIRSGILGPIKEIYVWTNRPIWPQGIGRPKSTPGIPNHVRWYEFLGSAPDRPYHPDYQPFKWRGWLDFGTGALGDMACHTINIACMALELFDPESIEVVDTSGIVDRESYPVWSIIRTRFGPRNGRGPLTMTWFDGGEKFPAEKKVYKEMLYGEEVAGKRAALGRRKGLVLQQERLRRRARRSCPRRSSRRYKKPKPTLPRSPGHFTEWVDAIKSGDPKKAMSNFDYAGRLTETVLLGWSRSRRAPRSNGTRWQ